MRAVEACSCDGLLEERLKQEGDARFSFEG